MTHNLKRSGQTRNDSIKAKMKKVSEVLVEPVKSYSDKKEYRLVRLPNGLTSLLVQHFIEDDEDDDPKEASKKEEQSENDSESDEEGGSDGSEGSHDEDSTKEKLAAVALCIDVGSWFDPFKIQGLSHFLEHMIFMGSEVSW